MMAQYFTDGYRKIYSGAGWHIVENHRNLNPIRNGLKMCNQSGLGGFVIIGGNNKHSVGTHTLGCST